MTEINKLSDKLAKLAKEIESLSVLKMAELAKYLEDKFKVSTATFAAQPTAAPAPTASSDKEEKTVFDVVLQNAGTNKLAVINAVREIMPALCLMDAKKLVESAPKPLLTGAKKDAAEEAKKKIEAAGGKVELK